MSELDAGLIQRAIAAASLAHLVELEVFDTIASTNTHLLNQAAPSAGRFRVAMADHQSSGRGRHNRRWLSPPGSGLCLSLAYTFPDPPQHLPALTLAIGVGIVDALQSLGIHGVRLKWPNDIVALDGKLGGVLTEVQAGAAAGVTVVTGIGLNVDLPPELDFAAESDWAHRVIDLKSVRPDYPKRELIAAALIGSLHSVMATFQGRGFEAFIEDWRENDWLRGRKITVDLDDRKIDGIAAGVDADGALLVETGTGQSRIISGSIILAGLTGSRR